MCTTSGRKKSWVILTIGSSRFITVSVLAGESAVKARLQTSFHTRTTASFTTWSSTNNAHFSILEDVMFVITTMCCSSFFEKKLQNPLHIWWWDESLPVPKWGLDLTSHPASNSWFWAQQTWGSHLRRKQYLAYHRLGLPSHFASILKKRRLVGEGRKTSCSAIDLLVKRLS